MPRRLRRPDGQGRPSPCLTNSASTTPTPSAPSRSPAPHTAPPAGTPPSTPNGWKTGFPFQGATAQEAIDRALRDHQADRALVARLEEAESAGTFADLTTGYTGPLHTQLDSLTRTPRRTGASECAICGLNPRTCDCR
ncbi:hypothetical protein [Streptomyces sp. H62]